MGIFDVFKRKSTFKKLDKMWALWEQGQLQLPCAKLMTYESEVNNGGHSQYFYNLANSGNLAEAEELLSLLPEPLLQNLNRAYVAFVSQENIDDDINEALFNQCDEVFLEHEQILIDMLYEAAKGLKF
jgi:hypothetical protein